jgi:hypothetical protein
MSNFKEKKECVCCGKNDLSLALDLNTQPLANSYHKEDEVLEEYPLGLTVNDNNLYINLIPTDTLLIPHLLYDMNLLMVGYLNLTLEINHFYHNKHILSFL